MPMPSARQFERLMRMDEWIRSGQARSIGQLAQKLEVSPRTISTDTDFLRDQLKAPLEFERGGRGWYYTDPQWRLPLVPLSEGELFALVLGSRMLEAAAGAAYSQELQSAIDRLVRRMPDQTWADLQTIVEERIQFGSGGLIDLNPEVWRKLTEASQANRVVEMTYFTASRNSLSTRKFNPYLLYVYRGTNPYAIGYCHQRKEIRYFRVDRIRGLYLSEERFEREPGFSAREYLNLVFQVEAGGQPQPVAVRFNAKVAPYIRERRWHRTQQIDEHGDGSLTLRMEVPGLAEVKRWVMGYGGDAVIEEPAELVAMISQEIAKMAAHYHQVRPSL
ncbi:helix-turn-helix transcriptional regulator [Gloeobacter morelensis]|nr:WYL domain-containing transcriptional regulator [Gloeobacter morelensis]